ncbi:MAG: GNAT family N-acetyltransferase [Rhodobacterales bacterium]|nr:MAG: GNAT family N-acetyltransferase [Rhodobacterales bacterium]
MLTLAIPTLETERLILRGPAERDFEAVASFFADKERSWGFGGPQNRNEAWRWFASLIGHWALKGCGFWMVETKGGDHIGMVGLWGPEGWPETELGWVMFENGEGKGYAFEAATAARDHAYSSLGFTTLSSNIFPGNTRSQALAKRMGATLERTYENVTHGTEEVWRHPGPEALA